MLATLCLCRWAWVKVTGPVNGRSIWKREIRNDTTRYFGKIIGLLNLNETANFKEVLFFDRAFSRIITVHLHLRDRPFSSTSMDQILTFISVTKINIVCSYLSIRELHQRNTIKLKNWSIKNSTGFREWILWDLLKSFLPENSLNRCDMRSW